ncbi:MAG: hypothetical protein SFV17_08170 [Candidatus Obscuribacter sp.]|nr:hypothetical protein [Candidatus Obscuribacter sp.]
MSLPIFTLTYVVSAGIGAAALARFGSTLATSWTGGNTKQMSEARKYATGLALVGGSLAACSPVNPLYAVFLSLCVGAFTPFVMGLWFAGLRVPQYFGKLLNAVDKAADVTNTTLADADKRGEITAQVVGTLGVAKEKVEGLLGSKTDAASVNYFPTTPVEAVTSDADASDLNASIVAEAGDGGGSNGGGNAPADFTKGGAGDGSSTQPPASPKPRVNRKNSKQ